MNFKEWYLRQGRTIATVNHYVGAIYGRLAEMGKEVGIITSIDDVNSVDELDAFINAIKAHPDFSTMNHNGNRMYSSALSAYRKYKVGTLIGVPIEFSDSRAIIADTSTTKTEKQSLIQARVGQGRFRAELIHLWNGRCSVTGYPDSRVLIASHIKPWFSSSNKERLDPNNGLLLTPNLDKVFDRGLISFDSNTGKILFSPNIVEPSALGLSDKMSISKLDATTSNYLLYHQRQVFLTYENIS